MRASGVRCRLLAWRHFMQGLELQTKPCSTTNIHHVHPIHQHHAAPSGWLVAMQITATSSPVLGALLRAMRRTWMAPQQQYDFTRRRATISSTKPVVLRSIPSSQTSSLKGCAFAISDGCLGIALDSLGCYFLTIACVSAFTWD